MHATKLKTVVGTILALGLLFGSLLYLTRPLAGKPNSKGPFNVSVPKYRLIPRSNTIMTSFTSARRGEEMSSTAAAGPMPHSP